MINAHDIAADWPAVLHATRSLEARIVALENASPSPGPGPTPPPVPGWPELLTSTGSIILDGNTPGATDIVFDVLDSFGDLTVRNNSVVTRIALPAGVAIGSVTVENCPNLALIELPTAQLYWGWSIKDCPALTSILLTAATPNPSLPVSSGQTYFTNNALMAPTINRILEIFDSTSINLAVSLLDFTGGTNAAPTGAGLVHKASLIVKGCVVNTNP